jgi:hypothetical protein
MLPAAAAGAATVALLYSFVAGPRNVVRMRGPDGREYEMQNLPDKESAVALMAKIHSNLAKLYHQYKEEPALAADPPVARFLERFSPDVFVENDMASKDTSYSENKGQKIVVCLRDKTKAPKYPLVDENTVMFVILHEMAHLMTDTIGHTAEFWANFKRILGDAVKIGIYTPVNYARKPTPYCGMTITDSPI